MTAAPEMPGRVVPALTGGEDTPEGRLARAIIMPEVQVLRLLVQGMAPPDMAGVFQVPVECAEARARDLGLTPELFLAAQAAMVQPTAPGEPDAPAQETITRTASDFGHLLYGIRHRRTGRLLSMVTASIMKGDLEGHARSGPRYVEVEGAVRVMDWEGRDPVFLCHRRETVETLLRMGEAEEYRNRIVMELGDPDLELVTLTAEVRRAEVVSPAAPSETKEQPA